MKSFWRNLLMAALVAALLGIWASTALAGGHPRGGHHGHYGHSSFGVGFGWAYPPPYWRPYPPPPGYYPGYYPGYAPAWGPGAISIGYGYGGHHSSYGLSFSFPLYLGPRYAPQPLPQPVPAASTAYRKPASSCLQVREYQTEIVIGGKTVPAYGDACLRPDGSWEKISGPFAAE